MLYHREWGKNVFVFLNIDFKQHISWNRDRRRNLRIHEKKKHTWNSKISIRSEENEHQREVH